MIEWFKNGQLANGKPMECSGCPLETLGQGFVPGEGSEQAEIMLVAEKAGEDEAVPTRCLTCSTTYEDWLTDQFAAGKLPDNPLLDSTIWRTDHIGHLVVGRPMIGGGGRLLDSMLNSAGIPRSQCFITNVVKCRVPFNMEPPSGAVDYCRQYHLRELEEVKPNVAVPIGNIALEWYTDHRDIRKYRGSVEPVDPARTRGLRKVLPILQPAGIMHSMGKHGVNQKLLIALTINDLRKLHRLRRDRGSEPLGEKFTIEPTIAQVRDFARSTGSEGYAVDIETPHDLDIYQCSLLCLAFHDYVTDQTLCIPFHTPQGDYWQHPEEELEAIALIQEMLAKPCDFHNAPFDVPILESMGWTVNLRDDTQVMDWQLNPENYHALHEVMKRHTFLPYHKDEGKGDPKLLSLPNHRFWNYNCKDSRGTAHSKPSLRKDLKEEVHWAEALQRRYSLSEYYDEITQPMIRNVIDMSKRGMGFSTSKRDEYLADVRAKQAELQNFLDRETGLKDFNPRGSKDLEEVLLNRLNLPVLERTPTGKPSFNEDTLLQLGLLYPGPLMNSILDLRGLLNLESTFLFPRVYPDGRVRVQWKITNVVTSRLASSPNLQNIIMTDGGRARSMYVSQEGNRIVHADHSQVELRVFAWTALDEEWMAMFREYDRRTIKAAMWRATRETDAEIMGAIHANLPWVKEALECQSPEDQKKYYGKPEEFAVWLWVRESDIHTANAAVMKQKPWRLITYDERFRAKIFIYGFLYGGSVEGILEHGGRGLSRGTDQIGVLTEMVANIIRRHPSLMSNRMRITSELNKTRKLVNMFGFVRYFFGLAKDIKRQGWDHEPQSTAASLINREFNRIAARVKRLTQIWGFVNQVHDSVMSEVPEEISEEVMLIKREEMHVPIRIRGEEVVFPAKVSIGNAWSDFS